jgi:hypothetical protein
MLLLNIEALLTVDAAKETVNRINHLADLSSKSLGRLDSFPPRRKPRILLFHDPIVATKKRKEIAGPKRRHMDQAKFGVSINSVMRSRGRQIGKG